jgi:hypothetical protein
MKTTLVIATLTGAAEYKLPTSMSREIGRIIVYWAFFEQCVQQMAWKILELTPPAARIAIREPRVEDRLTMVRDLVKLRKCDWDDTLYKSILTRTKLAAPKRDLVAHGLWGYTSVDGWFVELARGMWPKNLRQFVQGSRKVTTQLIQMDTAKLREATIEIDGLIVDLVKLRDATVGPGPSNHIHP